MSRFFKRRSLKEFKVAKEKEIWVLLGPSGSGKTTYGQREAGGEIMFLSTGFQLRKQNIINAWQEPNMDAVEDFCNKLINKTFEKFKKSKRRQKLILDCVKDLHGAEYIAALARKHDLKITRALLFDISVDILHERWVERGDNRDIFRGSAHAYLKRWKTKSNDLINYYKKSHLLYTKECINFTTVPCPNHVHYLLVDSAKITGILTQLLSILKVSRFHFTLPASSVHSLRDVTWVTSSPRYFVTTKTDGVRCLLLKTQGGTYLTTRKKEIFSCRVAEDQLPVGTVLDGELLPSTTISDIHPKISTLSKTNVFMVFDALAVAGDVLWMWPFSLRWECLRKLPISTRIGAVMTQAAADYEVLGDVKSQAVPSEEIDELLVNCVLKEHKPSTPDEVLALVGSLSQLSYPCDGLVFTPNTAYVFGPDPLLFKWQSQDSLHCDIRFEDLENDKRQCVAFDFMNKMIRDSWYELMREDILECQWNHLENAWDPLFVREDKLAPNSNETIDHVEKLCQQPYTMEHLIIGLTKIKDSSDIKDTTNVGSLPVVRHPSVGYSFDELYAQIAESVQTGSVEKTVDSDTKLEILSCTSSVRNPLISLCRGLVLHPDSKTIVTKPFVRFFEDIGERDPNEVVEATIKYDGSLGIAFLWRDEVMVTTKRRMDSEQAIWAKQWIVDHCTLDTFRSGFTYLFEIIYQDNTVVVNYPFEGLVLLAITDANGQELHYEELVHCARTIGFFMVTPRITASYSEVSWYCGGIQLSTSTVSDQPQYSGGIDLPTSTASKEPQFISKWEWEWESSESEDDSPEDVTGIDLPTSTASEEPQFISGALPVKEKQREGWVVKFKDGRRQKMVYSWWKAVSKLAPLVHPQIVWLLVKHDKINGVLGDVPSHFRVEINRMIRAIGVKFSQVVRDIEAYLKTSVFAHQFRGKSRKGAVGEWKSYGIVSTPSDESDDDSEEWLQLSEKTQQLSLQDDVRGDKMAKEVEDEKFGIEQNVVDIATTDLIDEKDENKSSSPFALKSDKFKDSEDKIERIKRKIKEARKKNEGKVAGGMKNLAVASTSRLSGCEEVEKVTFLKSTVLEESEDSSDETALPSPICDVSDESESSESESSESEDDSPEDVNCSDYTSSEDKKRSSEAMTNRTKDFIKLARKFKRCWGRRTGPKSLYRTHDDESVNFSPLYKPLEKNYLRLPILDFILPTTPVLDGYEPSLNFKQTICKGWKTLPINQFQFVQEVFQENHETPTFLQLPVELITLLLMYLDGESLAIMSRVCVQLRRIVKSSSVLSTKISTAKEEYLNFQASLNMYSYRSHYHYYRDDYWGASSSY